MARSSFKSQKAILDDACDFLRSFTLGRHGFTVRDGNIGIQRVTEQCERMKKKFASGPYTKQVATLLASARARIVAAETRLALLAKKHMKPA